MSAKAPSKPNPWKKTKFANLIRYEPSGTFYARIRVNGKLIRRSLKTDVLSVAKLRLGDLENAERSAAESRNAELKGKLNLKEASAVYLQRIQGDPALKPKTKLYHDERVRQILRTWPHGELADISRMSKSQCHAWAADLGKTSSPSVYNHAIAVLRHIIDIGIEAGARYDNPAKTLKRVSEKYRIPKMPESQQFADFVAEIENAGGRFSRHCAHLVRFLAYGGFRIGEVQWITWEDVDFKRGKIRVTGDPEYGTKNGDHREVPMIGPMKNLLEELRESRNFEANTERVIVISECQKAMDRAAKNIGMTRITHHSLRHLFATRCIESGVDIPTVSRWLGHKDGGALAMRVYGHLRDEHSASMAQKVSF